MPALPHEPLAPADFTLFNVDDCLPPSPSLPDAVAYALEHYPNFKFLPSNYDSLLNAASPATAHFACDDFRMYEFKVRRCMKGRSHDWTECPFAHPGEKARRRDPRRIHYSGAPCPDFRKGSCRRGDACEFAHGVFECWLHPARYRTQVCKDGKNCKRRVCFFAHSPEQLRVLPVSMACPSTANHTHMEKADGSPVGSPRGQFASIKCSAENFPSHEVFMPSSVGMLRAHSFNSSLHSFNSSSAMALPPSKTHSAAQGSPVSMHLDVSNGLALRRAMLQNMLAYKGYGANVNAEDYSGQEGLLEAQMLRPSYPVTPLHDKASACRKLSLLLEKKGYDPAVYSHGFASPTSTLEQHIFSPPPLSPPLSPSTSDEIKDSFTNPANGCQNLYVDNTVTPRNTIQPTYMYDNLSGIEGLGFCLQNLQLTHNSDIGFAPRSPHASGQGRMTDFAQQLRLPSFTRGASNLACVSSKQALWGSPCDFPDSEHSKQARDASAYELDACKIGEENTNMDNSVPDFGWVSELVK